MAIEAEILSARLAERRQAEDEVTHEQELVIEV